MIIPVYTIKAAVATSYGVPEGALVSCRRSRSVAYPRYAAFRMCRDFTPLSTPQIGRLFGGRDHTTILNGLTRAEYLMERDNDFRDRYLRAVALAKLDETGDGGQDPVFEHLTEVFRKIARLKGYDVTLERV